MKHRNRETLKHPFTGQSGTPGFVALIKLAGVGIFLTMGVTLLLGLCAQISYLLHIDENEGLVEWLQFALLLGCAIVLTARHGSCGRWLRLLVAAGFFVIAMEEINWAQPYLGYAPLAILADHNPYHEMAIHNSFGLEKFLRLLLVLGGTGGGALLLASIMRSRGMAGFICYVRRYILGPGTFICAGIAVMVAGRLLHPGNFFDFDEFAELTLYAGSVWFALSRPLEGLSLLRKGATRPA